MNGKQTQEKTAAPGGMRYLALDAFRGLTMAGMILVNNHGDVAYPQLQHAEWHGWTFCDLIFPSFVFCVGAALTFSFANRMERGQDRRGVYRQIFRRSYLIVGLGILNYYHFPPIAYAVGLAALLTWFLKQWAGGKWPGGKTAFDRTWTALFYLSLAALVVFDPERHWRDFRVPGVLQRIGLVYLFAALIVFNTGRKGQLTAAVLLLAVYWAAMKWVPVPGFGPGDLSREGNLAGYIDNLALPGHLYTPNWDPEGLFHTLPAIATGLLGALAGGWLREKRGLTEKISPLVIAGSVLVFFGLFFNGWFPINKNLWSPTYAMLCGGIDLIALGALVWLLDFQGKKRWAQPFVFLGANSLLVYFLSGLVHEIMRYDIPAPSVAGSDGRLWGFLYRGVFASWLGPLNGSLALSLSYVAFWMAVMSVFYRKKWFVKI